MAQDYKLRGMMLAQAYARAGPREAWLVAQPATASVSFPGAAGAETMRGIMAKLRANRLQRDLRPLR